MLFDRLPSSVGFCKTPVKDIRELPQVYTASPDFIVKLGNKELIEIVEAALTNIVYRNWKYITVDTRLAMLMPGWYPCIPGWHCDDFWRPTKMQPHLLTAPETEDVMVVLGHNSRTTFVAESLTIPINESSPDEHGNVYSHLHKAVEFLQPKTFKVNEREFIKFNQLSIHRGEPADSEGWRYFFRLVGSGHIKPKNEVRTQTQVYLTDPFKGW